MQLQQLTQENKNQNAKNRKLCLLGETHWHGILKVFAFFLSHWFQVNHESMLLLLSFLEELTTQFYTVLFVFCQRKSLL